MEQMTCPNCGANLQAKAGARKYICVYCDSEFLAESKCCPGGISSDNLLTPASELFDIQSEFVSQYVLESWTELCKRLNRRDSIDEYISTIQRVAVDYSDMYAPNTDSSILYKIEARVLGQFQSGERSLLFMDWGILSVAKDGILLTDRAIYRITKKNCRKLLYSDLVSITGTESIMGENVKWILNEDSDFDIHHFSISNAEVGVILGLVCTLARDNNSVEYTIKVYSQE